MTAQRLVFFTAATVVLLGIGLTGFNTVHWVSYVPLVLLSFAGVTGICPSLVVWQKLGFK